jgi:hypothetical protein
VVWTQVVGSTANGGTLTKNQTTKWGNGGAISSQILASGDGYVEFTVAELDTQRILGLSNGNTDNNRDDVDFGVHLFSDSHLEIWEKGASKANVGSYDSGDKIRVSVSGSVVKYWRNATLLYTSAAKPTYPLLVDTALYNQYARFKNTLVSGAWSGGPAVPSNPAVTWTSQVGVSAVGGTLTKTASTGWGNGGAVSVQTLASGDGAVEFTASETNTYRMLGLSNGNTSAHYNDIDFALYASGNQVKIYEKGVLRGSFSTFAPGDTLRVSVEGGVVKYWKNATLLYSSGTIPSFPLLVDSALYSQGATLTNAALTGNWR